MRVLFLSSRLSDRGGADRWLIGVLSRLQEHTETLLAVGRVDLDLAPSDLRRVGPVTRTAGIDRHGLGSRGQTAAVDRVRRLLREVQPDIVHVNDVTAPQVLAVAAATSRAVMTVQDHRFFCPGPGKVLPDGSACTSPMGDVCAGCIEDAEYRRVMLDLTRERLYAVAAMERVAVLSRYMARELVSLGVHHRRIVHLPPFVDGLACEAAPRPLHHLLVGRLATHKGIEVALRAALATTAGLPLVVAGAGPLEDEVARFADRHPRQVRYVGWAGRTRLAELLSGACSLWLPSLWAEPFGIAGLEALAAGVPVVASTVGGVTEWMDHEQEGLLVPPGSPRRLAEAADRMALDPDLARRLGRGGHLDGRRSQPRVGGDGDGDRDRFVAGGLGRRHRQQGDLPGQRGERVHAAEPVGRRVAGGVVRAVRLVDLLGGRLQEDPQLLERQAWERREHDSGDTGRDRRGGGGPAEAGGVAAHAGRVDARGAAVRRRGDVELLAGLRVRRAHALVGAGRDGDRAGVGDVAVI